MDQDCILLKCSLKYKMYIHLYTFSPTDLFFFIFQELRAETVRGHDGTEQGILGNYIFPLGMIKTTKTKKSKSYCVLQLHRNTPT